MTATTPQGVPIITTIMPSTGWSRSDGDNDAATTTTIDITTTTRRYRVPIINILCTFCLSLSRQTKGCMKQRHPLECTFLWVSLLATVPLEVVHGLQPVEVVLHVRWGIRHYTQHQIYRQSLSAAPSSTVPPISPPPSSPSSASASSVSLPEFISPRPASAVTPQISSTPPELLSSHQQRHGCIIMIIDLGITNLTMVAIEGVHTSLILDGKALVSRFRWAAKSLARLQARQDHLIQKELDRGGTVANVTSTAAAPSTQSSSSPSSSLSSSESKKREVEMTIVTKKARHRSSFPHLRRHIARIAWKVRWFVHVYLHKFTTWLITVEVTTDVSKIYGGALPRVITTMDAARKVNEMLHRLSFGWIVTLLTYKAVERWISVSFVNESCTSQIFSHRGHRTRANWCFWCWFHCCHRHFQLNADVNESRNLLWSVVPFFRKNSSKSGMVGWYTRGVCTRGMTVFLPWCSPPAPKFEILENFGRSNSVS